MSVQVGSAIHGWAVQMFFVQNVHVIYIMYVCAGGQFNTYYTGGQQVVLCANVFRKCTYIK